MDPSTCVTECLVHMCTCFTHLQTNLYIHPERWLLLLHLSLSSIIQSYCSVRMCIVAETLWCNCSPLKLGGILTCWIFKSFDTAWLEYLATRSSAFASTSTTEGLDSLDLKITWNFKCRQLLRRSMQYILMLMNKKSNSKKSKEKERKRAKIISCSIQASRLWIWDFYVFCHLYSSLICTVTLCAT